MSNWIHYHSVLLIVCGFVKGTMLDFKLNYFRNKILVLFSPFYTVIVLSKPTFKTL